MLLHNKKTILSIFLISLFFFTECKAIADVNVKNFLSIKDVDELNLMLKEFSDEKFSHYLKSINNYDLLEHETAIRKLFTVYRKDYLKLETCSTKVSNHRKKYSDKWLKELIKKYGAQYVEKNYESIKKLLVNLFLNKGIRYCIDDEKDILYSEIQYIKTVKDFCQSYIDFCNSLSENEKKIYNDKKKNANALLKVAAIYPMQEILYGGRVGHYLDLKNKVTLKNDVFDFINNHPQFSKPFDAIKAVDDLRATVKQ